MMALKVLKKELKENLRKKRVVLSAILMAAVVLVTVVFLSNILSSVGPIPEEGLMTTFIISVFPVFIAFIILAMVSQDVVFVEKMKKGYENLLATPISVNDLVLGKTLFTFLYTYSLILGLMLIFLGVLSIYDIAYPLLYSLADLLVILPVTVFAIVMILTSVALQFRAGQQIMQILLFFVVAVVSGVFYASPYILHLVEGLPYQAVFALSILSIAIILAAAAIIIFKNVDKEKIILTS